MKLQKMPDAGIVGMEKLDRNSSIGKTEASVVSKKRAMPIRTIKVNRIKLGQVQSLSLEVARELSHVMLNKF